MNNQSDSLPVKCQHLWKIFGLREEEALSACLAEGVDKDYCLSNFDCIIGVRDVSFTINQGEIFCIMGLSGSGKSTLLRLINRLIKPSRGTVFINGEDIGTLRKKELHLLRNDKIGMVFQNPALWPHRNIRKNISFGLEVRKIDKKVQNQAVDRAIDLVKLSGYENYYPKQLSGGMQQRVGLARALASDPDILLMDEPFSALDPLIRRKLQDQFLDISSIMNKTTLFITHDLDEAIRLGDRIAIMKDGVLVQVGTPEEIVTNPADDYVADFVAGISRLHLVYAHKVMYPVEQYQSLYPDENLVNIPQVGNDDDLYKLTDIMVESDVNKLAVVRDGRTIGIITRRSLLRGIQGFTIEDVETP